MTKNKAQKINPVRKNEAIGLSNGVKFSKRQNRQYNKNAGGALVKDIQLFDIYRGEQIGSGKKSLAFAIKYGRNDRTLSNKEAKKNQDKIIRAVEKRFGAKIRDNTKSKQINK